MTLGKRPPCRFDRNEKSFGFLFCMRGNFFLRFLVMLEKTIFRFPSFIEPPPKNSADSSSGNLTLRVFVQQQCV